MLSRERPSVAPDTKFSERTLPFDLGIISAAVRVCCHKCDCCAGCGGSEIFPATVREPRPFAVEVLVRIDEVQLRGSHFVLLLALIAVTISHWYRCVNRQTGAI